MSSFPRTVGAPNLPNLHGGSFSHTAGAQPCLQNLQGGTSPRYRHPFASSPSRGYYRSNSVGRSHREYLHSSLPSDPHSSARLSRYRQLTSSIAARRLPLLWRAIRVLAQFWGSFVLPLLTWWLWMLSSPVVVVFHWLVVFYTVVRIIIVVVGICFTRSLRYILRKFFSLRAKLHIDDVGGREEDIILVKKVLRTVTSYEEWVKASYRLDMLEGNLEWRFSKKSSRYNCKLVEHQLRALRDALGRGDIHGTLLAVQPCMSRDFAGLSNPALHVRLRVGTKQIIEDFTRDLCLALDFILQAPDDLYPKDEKLSFFARSRQAYGGTALCLSGGGSLSMYHCGVVRELLLAGLLPNVVSGSSGGSIVAALMAIRTDEELLDDITPEISTKHGVRWFEPTYRQVLNFMQNQVLMDSAYFQHTTQAYYSDYTFAEAFHRTGRNVNITITASLTNPGGANSHSLLLNHLTAPDVYLWSAVCCSCSLPGLMEPGILMAKGRDGTPVPFYPSKHEFVDGSIKSDLPKKRLTELFNVNHFLVSQVNPHVRPFSTPARKLAVVKRKCSWVLDLETNLLEDLQHRVSRLTRLKVIPRIFGQDMSGVLMQEYSGQSESELTVYPNISLFDHLKVISHPSREDMKHFIEEGQRSIWPHLAQIRHRMIVEKKLDDCLWLLENEASDSSPQKNTASPAAPRRRNSA